MYAYRTSYVCTSTCVCLWTLSATQLHPRHRSKSPPIPHHLSGSGTFAFDDALAYPITSAALGHLPCDALTDLKRPKTCWGLLS
jgi:hypothetical protein